MAPVFFLLLNRVFSPQYLVLMLVAWALAGALLLERRSDQLRLGAASECDGPNVWAGVWPEEESNGFSDAARASSWMSSPLDRAFRQSPFPGTLHAHPLRRASG